MQFERGDDTYKGQADSAGHELYVATENRRMFIRSVELAKSIQDNILIDAMCYQHYAEFVRSIYEYYVAIMKWNARNTHLRDFDWDSKMNEAAQRLLNLYGPVRRPIDRSFPDSVPKDFGSRFRQVRNRTSHADYRRMNPVLGEDEMILASFFRQFDFYCSLLLEHAQFSWGGKRFVTGYSWEPVNEFMRAVREAQQENREGPVSSLRSSTGPSF